MPQLHQFTTRLIIFAILARYWTISLAVEMATTTTTEIPLKNAKLLAAAAAAAEPRSIDGLAGPCGRTPGSAKWIGRDDAFCDNGSGAHEGDEVGVDMGEFPSVVFLEIRSRSEKSNNTIRLTKCLGVLVHSDLVMTAGGCIRPETISLRAIVGLIDERVPPAGDTQQSYAWGYCRLKNKERRKEGDDDDIALVQLRTPFTYNDRVQPACVEPTAEPKPNGRCYLPGLVWTNDTIVAKRKVLISLRMQKCLDSELRGWTGIYGACFKRRDVQTNLAQFKNSNFWGSGLYCLDSCTKPSTLYVIGISVRSLGVREKSFLEYAHISRNFANRADIKRMLQKCYEFVKE